MYQTAVFTKLFLLFARKKQEGSSSATESYIYKQKNQIKKGAKFKRKVWRFHFCYCIFANSLTGRAMERWVSG
ncbi:MAG: hypothetical protein COW65_09215 [Cytophagales bacterium CG18_big_fil_WC_8_21_14_2_50_42_9]|nr:MAG: hypothetical protein COW65_09215 [Cytophagales bacterium CG18_big_fil_WC_8_21_14_2_50_42_9]